MFGTISLRKSIKRIIFELFCGFNSVWRFWYSLKRNISNNKRDFHYKVLVKLQLDYCFPATCSQLLWDLRVLTNSILYGISLQRKIEYVNINSICRKMASTETEELHRKIKRLGKVYLFITIFLSLILFERFINRYNLKWIENVITCALKLCENFIGDFKSPQNIESTNLLRREIPG